VGAEDGEAQGSDEGTEAAAEREWAREGRGEEARGLEEGGGGHCAAAQRRCGRWRWEREGYFF
jgi:hypothetical protein